MSDPLQPGPAILAKLASVVVHIDEHNGPNGHKNDMEAINSLLQDAELADWIVAMQELGMAPARR